MSDTVGADVPDRDRPQGGEQRARSRGLGARLALFYRQVVAELRKVDLADAHAS